MNKDIIEDLFENLQHEFDVEAPSENHKKRFMKKLNNQDIAVANAPKRNLWKPFMAIAASIAILISVFVGTQQEDNTGDLASISPEMAETQNFFNSTIASELIKIEKESNPETKLLVADAMMQLQRLEKEYESLKNDLSESGNDNRVVYAMISNFQSRIDILQNTLKQIENVKQLKNNHNENSTTI
jgi:septal ring factor EnvC (AmiA/AmiB activator)